MQTVTITGPIDDLKAQFVADSLSMMNRTQPVLAKLNSDGGSVQAGVSIYAALSTWPAGVEIEVTGWALSIASLILMAGGKRTMHPTGAAMVHAPWISPGSSNAPQLRRTADALDVIGETMLAAYRRTGQPEAVIRGWLDGQDHWLTAEQALAAGLITEIVGAPVQASSFDNFTTRVSTLPAAFARNIMTQPDQAAMQAGIRAEVQRRTEIQGRFAGFASREGVAELQRQCENDPTITAQAAAERLLAHLGSQSAPIAGSYRIRESSDRLTDFRAAAQDVLLQRAGFKVAEPHPAARDLQRYSLTDMAESFLSMTGRAPRAASREQIISAALSTSDFPSLLSNTANKALALGYTDAPAGHALWTGEREVADFKPATLVNLSEAPSLELVVELGEYRAGSLSDSVSTFQLGTYGKLLHISRQSIVNDDLSAFTKLPQAMGQAARRLEADKTWAMLTSNPTLEDGNALFHASHGNLGTAAALSAVALAAGRAAMRKQKALAGQDYIDPQPRFLLVPVALETLAEQIVASTVDTASNNNTPNPEFIRRLTVVADPRLDAVSATAWYLAASPAQMDTITRAYLAGEPRPFLDENAEFARDAMSYKVRLDFAVGVMEWRGLYRNPGA